MQAAPFFAELAQGPQGGRALWVTTEDGLRIRLGHWPAPAASGTVLLLPGRTEYIEKYGHTARALAEIGLGTLTIDWRGQGLSDRLSKDVLSGHVLRFSDYQADLRAMCQAAEALNLPRPWHVLAHSMGGCIALRGLIEGLPVASCVFTGPMWGIRMRRFLRPIAWALSWGVRRLGLGHRYTPSTSKDCYILHQPFEANKLTRDRDMYAYLIAQCRAHPELRLGGPSLHWLYEALCESRLLARRPSPDLPCLTIVGSNEEIVDTTSIRTRMADWPGGILWQIDGARHEVLMETPETRAKIIIRLNNFYTAAANAGNAAPTRAKQAVYPS